MNRPPYRPEAVGQRQGPIFRKHAAREVIDCLGDVYKVDGHFEVRHPKGNAIGPVMYCFLSTPRFE